MLREARLAMCAALVASATLGLSGCGASESRDGMSATDEIAFLAAPQGMAGPDAVFREPDCEPTPPESTAPPCASTVLDVAIAGVDTEVTRLTTRGGYLLEMEYFNGIWDRPMWSPDGSAIAITRGLEDESYEDVSLVGRREVWIVDRDGGERRVDVGLAPAWSPDGNSIAYMRVRGESAEIVVAHRDGTGQGVVAAAGMYPSWSPDGTRILYMSTSTDAMETWVVDADGRGSPEKFLDGGLAQWSPDGKRVAYWVVDRSRRGSTALFVADSDARNPRKLADLSVGGFSWSPDGTRIAVVETTFDHDWAGPLRVVEASGSNPKTLARDVVGHPTWSPDGTAIAVAKLATPGLIVRQNESSIYTLKPDGTSLTRVSTGTFDLHPAWRPVQRPGS